METSFFLSKQHTNESCGSIRLYKSHSKWFSNVILQEDIDYLRTVLMSANHSSFPNIDFHILLTTWNTFYLRIFVRYINLVQFSTSNKHGMLLLKYENIKYQINHVKFTLSFSYSLNSWNYFQYKLFDLRKNMFWPTIPDLHTVYNEMR